MDCHALRARNDEFMSVENETVENNSSSGLARYLTPLGAFALSFGVCIGWGSFVMPGTSFLPAAGPLGTLLGFIIGIFVMLIIIGNYHYLMNKYPDCGGTFTYAKKVFGYDHGFLSAWFLVLTYVAILWANDTAIPLVCRLLGDSLTFGFLYSIGDYKIFFGEVLISIIFLFIFAAICAFRKDIAIKIQTVTAFGMFLGLLICFIAIIMKHSNSSFTFEPYFIPNRNIFYQIFSMAMVTPWAFVGLESISHSSEEFKFSTNKSFQIMLIALILGAISYIFVAIASVSIIPENYTNWLMYISDLDNISGKASLPILYAAENSLGTFGISLFFITACCGIITGMIGCYTASSRLLYSMAKDGLLPAFLGKLNSKQIPQNAIFFIAVVSIVIPFCQRTAIGWIVDLTTFGAALAFAYASACAYKTAKDENNKKIKIYGILGLIISAIFTFYLLIPYRTIASLSKESYLIITIWCVLGLLFFRIAFANNPKKLYNTANTVWVSLLILILFTSQIWVNINSRIVSENVVTNIDSQYDIFFKTKNFNISKDENERIDQYISGQIKKINQSIFLYGIISLVFVLLVLTIMFSIYRIIRREEELEERDKEEIERTHKIKIGFLFNMSHDIRTPMNAIIGYTTLAQKEKDVSKIQEYLTKIGVSSQHMLSILNDVIEMSRIESHRKELVLSETDLNDILEEVRDVFAGDMDAKHIKFTVNADNLTNPIVLSDKNCLSRVLFNTVGNALKFTPENGEVSVTLSQTGKEEKIGNYVISVKDNGIGISEEFLPKLFNAFEREKTSTDSGLQGTGLGLSITKSIIDLMKGIIEVKSKQGEGSEFIFTIPLEIVEKHTEVKEEEKRADDKPDFSNMKLLLVEDIVINMQIAKMLLEQMGFAVDTAENGKIAVEKYSNSKPGEYSAIIMDIQMPVMNGYDASIAIRSLENKEMANIPIIAMTANVLPEDVQKAKESGMNGHIAKPINVAEMTNTLVDILIKGKRG